MKTTLKHILLFTFFLLFFLLSRNLFSNYLLNIDINSYNYHLVLKIFLNIILASVSFVVAKKLNLINLGGLSNVKPQKLTLLIFPIIFLTLLNGIFLDNIPNFSLTNLLLLIIYCISIGFSEELSLRSVLLPLLSRFFNNSRKAKIKAILISSLIFGLLHLIKFDKGIYGEVSQLFFATFIGVMFGALLVVTKRVYPLIIIHAIVDFVAKLDSIGLPIKSTIYNPMDLESAIISSLLTLPCLIYGLFLIKKHIPKLN
ncbi:MULTISPECIES: CPBP family intramembrane glutamic endopeptidase [Polaribacter]|uniref:CPBP family intramembrane glutamic endopeptidase n=1 Tax=Polaribacter marinaquae TaxID=1642819 RepID=A0ABZ2TTJ9_9FLAO